MEVHEEKSKVMEICSSTLLSIDYGMTGQLFQVKLAGLFSL
jgi:hypothetical protein